MIIEDYVSFEVAKLLKEKGFDWECLGTYSTGDKELSISSECPYSNDLNDDMFIAAPTHQTAMKWLRKERIIIVIQPEYFNLEYKCSAWGVDIWCDDNYEKMQGNFPTYEEACEAAIKYCLTNLI